MGSPAADVRLGHHQPTGPRPRRPRRRDLVLHPAEGVDAARRRGGRPAPAPRPSRPRRSGCSSSDPSRGTRCRPPCGPGCGRRRSRRGTAPAATGRRTAATSTPASSCAKPVTSRPRWIGTASSSTQPARMRSMWFCHSAEPVGVAGGEVADVQPDRRRTPATCATCPSARNRSAMPALVEHLDRARVQAARARAGELLARRAARRSRRRRPPAPARPPASAPSDRLRRSPPHASIVLPLADPSSNSLLQLCRCLVGPASVPHDRGLAAGKPPAGRTLVVGAT